MDLMNRLGNHRALMTPTGNPMSLFRAPETISPSMPSPSAMAAAGRSIGAVVKPWWDTAGKYSNSLGPAAPLVTSGGPLPIDPMAGTPNPLAASGATSGPYTGQSLDGGGSSVFDRLKNSTSNLIGRVGGLIGNPDTPQPQGDPAGAGNEWNSQDIVVHPRPLSDGGFHGGIPVAAPQGYTTGGGFGASAGAVPMSSGGAPAAIPMPRERPQDLNDMSPMASAMAASASADPSKIIMYGTGDNPNVGPSFDWRKLFGR